jgi:hypothetical protein
MYEIKARQKRNAKKLGVEIKPSTNKKKKIDIYANNKKIASIGATSYKDYATYIETDGKEYADKRKKAYRARHEKTRKIIGSNSYYADQILWT